MGKLVTAVALISLLLLPLRQSALAWNNTGHLVVACIAYQNLTPGAKTKVDEGIPPNDPNFGLRVFMRAATWPDLIKGDPRFIEGDEPAPDEMLHVREGDPP